MALTSFQWQKILAADALRPAYLLVGEELLVLEAADALRAQARRLGYSERHILDAGPHFDWNDLARAAASQSLFATRRIIDLRLPTGRPGKDGAAAVIEFCDNAPPDTSLLVSAISWSSKHVAAWSRKIEATGAMVVFHAPRPHEWATWMTARLATHGLTATPDALALLTQRVEGNLLAAAQEIDKLAILYPSDGTNIDLASMEKMVSDNARYDVFKLSDVAFSGEGSHALRILSGLHAQGEELINLMGWLVNQLQLVWRLANARDFKTQSRNERLWPAREQLFKKAVRRAGREHWLACLDRASSIDRIVKGRQVGDAWRELECLVVMIAVPDLTEALV